MGLICMKEVRIYALEKNDIKYDTKEKKLVVDETRALNTINMSNTFFMMAYIDAFKSDADIVEDIVKVAIPTNWHKELLTDGFYMKGKKYIAYTSTPSLQKYEGGGCKTEFIFISEEKEKFISYFEKLISLGRFEEKFNNKEIAIAKKVTSRTALAFSDVTKINCFNPRIIVVKNHEYPIPCTIDTIETTGKGEKRTVITEGKKPVLIRDMEYSIEHTCNDGMGLMSPLMAQVIRESMGLEYDVYFAVIRGFMGLAVKGMCMTFDYVSYFEEYNQQCTRKYGCYTVVDAYGVDRDIRECDLLLTTSQAKWWENFKQREGHQEEGTYGIGEVYNQLCKIQQQSTKDLVSALYVTKVNKNPSKLPTHCLTNYQLIGNLDLDYQQYKALSEPTYQLYKGVMDGDMDYIRLFLKNISEGNTERFDDDGEVIDDYKETLQPSTITEGLLNHNQDFYSFDFIKNNLKTLVQKKKYELASGRIFVSGLYTYLAQDPIFMLNKLIGIETDGELASDEYYCNGLKKEWLSQRCPCNAFNEIVTFNTTTNDAYNKYLSHVGREMVVYNAKSLTLVQQSTADVDGDAVLLSDDETLIGGVIKTKSFFYNLEDGETKKEIYNRTNKIKSLYETGGNLIGKIAIKGGIIANRRVDSEDKLPLLYLTLLMQQIAIDCPKSGINVPSSMQELLRDALKWDKKPYFMKWAKKSKDTSYTPFNEEFIECKDVRSTLDRYAEYVMKNLRNDKEKDGGHEVSKFYNFIEAPEVDCDVECVDAIKKLKKNNDNREEALKDEFDTENGKLLTQIDLYKERIKETRFKIKDRQNTINELCSYADNCDDVVNDLYYEIYELEEHLKDDNRDLRKLHKELEPAKELLKVRKKECRANTALMAQKIVEKYGENIVIKSLMSTKGLTMTFLLSNFYELIIKYIPCKNSYVLQEVYGDMFDFEHLGHKYIKKEVTLEDSHIVAQNIVAAKKAYKKKTGLGINVDKVNIKFIDTSWAVDNYMSLKGKTLNVVESECGKYVQLELDGTKVAGFYSKMVEGIDMSTVSEIKVFDIQPLGKVFKGASGAIWFEV